MSKVVKIIYIQYTNPGAYPPLVHSSHLLADEKLRILFLGTRGFGCDDLVFDENSRITVRLMPACRAGFFQKIHYFLFSFWVVLVTLFERPRWIYASDHFSCFSAVMLHCLGFDVIYHEHDAPIYNEGENSTGWFKAICLFRRLLAREAKLVIMPNQERIKIFVRETGRKKKIICAFNCPALREVTGLNARIRKKEMLLLYHGSIGPSRFPLTVLEAVARSGFQLGIRVIGYETIGHQGYTLELLRKAKELGISHLLEIKGAVPRHKLLDVCAECDIGLALMPINTDDVNMKHMVGASNKVFDYLACGLAVLVADLPAWIDAYVKPGYGLSCNPADSYSIESALTWFLNNPEKTYSMGIKGRQRVLSEWNYEFQFKDVFAELIAVNKP